MWHHHLPNPDPLQLSCAASNRRPTRCDMPQLMCHCRAEPARRLLPSRRYTICFFAGFFRFSRPQPVAVPAPKRERLIQRHPTLWSAKCETPRMWCGPVAVAAIIGVDPVTVCDVIQQQRKNRRPVKRTYPHELHAAFAHFGYDMTPGRQPWHQSPDAGDLGAPADGSGVGLRRDRHRSLGGRSRPMVLRYAHPRRAG